jgi:peptide/nickel transport system substrate-binding protein
MGTARRRFSRLRTARVRQDLRVASRRTRLVLVAAAVASLALVTSGCGGSSSNANAPAAENLGTPVVRHAPFPVFRTTLDTGLDSLDPGQAHSPEAWQTLWNVYLTLVGYRHASGSAGATLVPVLAKALPQVSADGRTYTLTLRPGLRYSNGQPVKASDFAATIERDYRLRSDGAAMFDSIVGAARFGVTRTGHIGGIVTDDATGQITIHLVAPRSDFPNVLASIFAAPLPAGTPPRDLSAKPPPSTGPYTIASYKSGRQIVIVRNPHYKSLAPNVPDGNPNKVVVTVVPDDTTRLDDTIGGKYDYDYPPIPFDRLDRTAKKYPARLFVYTGANTYYFFMNSKEKPFDDIRVRKAVNYAIDRDALVRQFGGLAAPTQNVLPPTDPQYRKIQPYAYDLNKARQLVIAAGAKHAHVVVWGSNRPTAIKPVDYLVAQLQAIGIDAKAKIVDGSTYWQEIGDAKNHAAIGFADWFENYPHPLDWFGTLIDGHAIRATENQNYAHANVPSINALIASLSRRPSSSPQAEAQWATLDRLVVDRAFWAPFVNRNFTAFVSPRIDPKCAVIHPLYDFDWSTICQAK